MLILMYLKDIKFILFYFLFWSLNDMMLKKFFVLLYFVFIRYNVLSTFMERCVFGSFWKFLENWIIL